MQCGQIERIWFEDNLFSSHSYLSALEDDISPPARKHTLNGGMNLWSKLEVGDRVSASAASLSSWMAVNETPATH